MYLIVNKPKAIIISLVAIISLIGHNIRTNNWTWIKLTKRSEDLILHQYLISPI